VAQLETVVKTMAQQQAEIVNLMKAMGTSTGSDLASLMPIAKMFLGGGETLDQELMSAMKQRLIQNLTANPVDQSAKQFKSLMDAVWYGVRIGRGGAIRKEDLDKIE